MTKLADPPACLKCQAWPAETRPLSTFTPSKQGDEFERLLKQAKEAYVDCAAKLACIAAFQSETIDALRRISSYGPLGPGRNIMLASLLTLVAILAFAGVFLWALTQFPMDPTIAKVIRVVIVVVVAIFVIYWLLGLAQGGLALGGPSPFGRLR